MIEQTNLALLIIKPLISNSDMVDYESQKEALYIMCTDIIEKLHCKEQLKNINWLKRSCGTLGGGNHFIEVDGDSKNNKYLVIHSGSRNIGKQVAEIYQQMAIDDISGKSNFKQDSEKLIAEYKKCKRERGSRHSGKE